MALHGMLAATETITASCCAVLCCVAHKQHQILVIRVCKRAPVPLVAIYMIYPQKQPTSGHHSETSTHAMFCTTIGVVSAIKIDHYIGPPPFQTDHKWLCGCGDHVYPTGVICTFAGSDRKL